MQRWIYLTAILSLVGCAGLKKFPEKDLYSYDFRDPDICRHFEISDYNALKYRFVGEIPIASCPIIFGFSAQGVPKVLTWGRESIDYGKTHCQ